MSEFVSPGDTGRTVPTTVDRSTRAIGDIDWQSIERDSDFQELVREKRNFIIPATIFFLVYYFAFLILVGYFPDVVNVNVIGNINVAYLFALSQFIMVWVLMAIYVRRAGTFDKLAQRIVAKVRGGRV